MWDLSVPWWELVLRATAVFAFLILLLRVTGKRQIGQLSPMDLVLLLVLSNAVQNAMNAGDNSLTGGLISATVLVTLNWLLNFVTFRSKKLADLVDTVAHLELYGHGRHALRVHENLNRRINDQDAVGVLDAIIDGEPTMLADEA